MPVRALRRHTRKKAKHNKDDKSESKNARQGIKTTRECRESVGNSLASESKNARQGIKTLFALRCHIWAGIACQNQKMPVRALRLDWVLGDNEDKDISQNQKMPVRALRLKWEWAE